MNDLVEADPIARATRLSFSKINPKHQLAWDNTSLSSLKRCPRFYEYNIIMGYVTRMENVHLKWGSAYNNCLVTYHQWRTKGASHQDAMLKALRYALETTWDHELGRPWASDEPTKTRETLVRSVIWYLTKFEEDPLQTVVFSNGEPALELRFQIALEVESGLTGEPYVFCGYLDREVDFNDHQWITDWKSTKYALDEKYFAKYTPDNQVSQYSFAGNIVFKNPIQGVIIDAVQLGVTFSRFQRQHITRTPKQLEEWLRDSLIHIKQNESFVEDDYWPQDDTACEKYGGCPYRGICSKSPEYRQEHLDKLFYKRTWDPLVTREV